MRIAEYSEVSHVLLHDDIFPHISDTKDKDIEFPISCKYITETGEDIFILDDEGDIHFNILKSQRHRSDELGSRAISWFFSNCDIDVIKSQIPVKYKNVIDCAKRLGFQVKITDNIANVKIERSRWDSLES